MIKNVLLLLGVAISLTIAIPEEIHAATPYEQYKAEERAKIAAAVPDIEALRVQLEAAYGISIVPEAKLKSNQEDYAACMYYCWNALSELPAPWVQMVANTSRAKSGKKLTIILPAPSGTMELAGTVAEGIYTPKSNSVKLYSLDSFTMAHELGHAFFEVCRAKQPGFTETWQSYNVSGTYKGRANYWQDTMNDGEYACFVSEYAMISINEDFAESCGYAFVEYAREVQNGTINRRPYLRQKVEYIKALSNAFAGAPILN